MYKSPVEIVCSQMQQKMADDILLVVHKCGIDVDKEELLKALAYDRDQYDRGYNDGRRASMDSIVRCKECRHWGGVTFGYICRRFSGSYIRNETRENDFCSYGERKGGEQE